MAEQVLEKVKGQLADNQKIQCLGKVFHTYDSAGARRVDAQEFFVGLCDQGAKLSKEEAECLLACLDTNGDGNVNYDNFLCAMRGELNATRKGVTEAAFAKFDATGCGMVKSSDLKVVMDVSAHPKVISGDITDDEAFLEFLSNFGDKNNDGCITLTEWCDYYSAISACISDDEHYVSLMSRTWGL
mgnify:CR=1 FL=1